MKCTHLLLSIAVLSAMPFRAQIIVDSLAIEAYVQDVLLGSGIQATNISFTGCLNQIGYLQGGESVNLGIDGGVILSTDHVRNVEVPSPFLGIWEGNCAVSGDPDLLTIANSVPPLIGQNFGVGSVNDLSVLEFDFIPTGDTLRFNYIFGSDEYLTWVNTGYNDIFAFLLSGPGITGPYDSPAGFPGGAVNIAQLPNTNPPLPITISSVNNVLNSDYYIDNPSNTDISINGYTVVLEAMYLVQCGLTYHIKLAIADGSDTALESIVVLEEGSFASNSVVDVDLTINVGPPDVNTLYEDCGEASITFTRAAVSSLDVEDMVVVTWGGDATMGIDYSALPDTIVFPVGVASVSFELDAFEDGLTEGQELVNMDILNLAACNGSGLVSNFQFWIDDEPAPLVVEGYDTEICLGASTVLVPNITGGYGNFHYEWSTGEDTPEIEVAPISQTSYFLTVSDTCGMPSDDAQFLVNILVFDPLAVSIDNGSGVTINCNEQVVITATGSGGNQPYTYTWTDANGNNLFGFLNQLWYSSWNGPGEVTVSLTDACGLTATDVIDVSLNVPPLVIDVPDEIVAPCNQVFIVNAAVSGGQAPYFYTWTLNGITEWDEWDNIYDGVVSQPGTLVLSVGDNCGQNETVTMPITIDSPPINIDLVDAVTGTCATNFNFAPVISGGSGGFQYQWTNNGTTLGTQATLNYSSDVSTQVNLQVSDACGAEATDAVTVTIENPEIFVELGDDIFASCLDDTELTAGISGGSGGNTFEWSVLGQIEGTAPAFTIQSFETVDVNVLVTDACGMQATDVVTIFIPDIPLTIEVSADTSICQFGVAELWALAGGGEGGFTYLWETTGSVGNELFLSNMINSGTYTVIATDQCGKTIEDEVFVEVRPLEAGFAATLLSENEYQFTAMPSPECDDCVYMWDLGDGTTSTEESFIHLFDGLDSYTVWHTVVNGIGCTDNAFFTVVSPPQIYIPNTFTPNNDGINDVFAVVGSSVMEFELNIFNRWGEVVFSTNDITKVWMGDFKGTGQHFVPDGVYSYVAKIKGFNSDAFEKVGNITLTR
jgi:gliding motility-associated-like protein